MAIDRKKQKEKPNWRAKSPVDTFSCEAISKTSIPIVSTYIMA